MNKRPHTKLGTLVATPEDATMLELLGGQTHDGVGLTQDQIKRLWKLYGFQDEHDHRKDPLDHYEDRISADKRHVEKCEEILRQEGISFRTIEPDSRGRVALILQVPRGFRGRKVSLDEIGGFGQHAAFEIRSWERLQQNAVEATNFAHTGSTRNMVRLARQDGLRIMALLSQFCEPGEDPVRLVCNVLAEAGFDAPYMGAVDEDEDEDWDDDE